MHHARDHSRRKGGRCDVNTRLQPDLSTGVAPHNLWRRHAVCGASNRRHRVYPTWDSGSIISCQTRRDRAQTEYPARQPDDEEETEFVGPVGSNHGHSDSRGGATS
jgi:hypothetical protein